MTTVNYYDLSVAELAKLINDQYAVILGNERANYPRALSIGEKLVALRRGEGVEHGEWQTKLKTLCPNISYETATKYIRCWQKQPQILKAAAAKSVATTDLTIELALSLIAKPKQKTTDTGDTGNVTENTGDGKPTVEAMEARQAANAEAEAATLNDVDIDAARLERVDEAFEWLMRIYPQDELLDLTERLAKHLGLRLEPISKMEALETLAKELAEPEAAPVA